MILFLRETQKIGRWSNLDVGDPASVAAAVGDFVADDDTKVSLFRSRSRSDAELIAAALFSRYSSSRTFRYLKIDRGDLKAVGARVRFAFWRKSPVYIVGFWHREVDLSRGRAEQLIRILGANGPVQPERISGKEMKARARNLYSWQHQFPENSWLVVKQSN